VDWFGCGTRIPPQWTRLIAREAPLFTFITDCHLSLR
jgi:hypothetical protein